MTEESRIKIMREPKDAAASQTGSAMALRSALESLDGFWEYRCDGEDEKKRSCNVVFPQSAYRTVVEHLGEDKTREHGGFLLGYETHIGEAQAPTVVIEEAVPAKFTHGTPVRLTFTTDTWRSLDEHTDRLREQGRILQRVGWYHSHPNIAIFLSHWDLDVCKTFDQRRSPIALVVDPVNQRGGFFVGTNKVYNAHSPHGFYELPDLQLDPMVTWRNMTRQDGFERLLPPESHTEHEGKLPAKADAVAPPESTHQSRWVSDVQPGLPRLAIVLSVLSLLVSLGGLGVLHETQKEFAAHLKYNEQDLSSLKISVLNLSKSLEAIDAVADNVTDLRTKVEKGKGSSKPISVSVRVSPTKVNLVQSETIIFHANVAGTSDLGVRWTTSPSHGTIKPNGEYKAPASISKEEYVTVKATSVADASKSSTAIVNLKPKLGRKANEPVSEVAVQVTPDHASLAAGEKQIFTATVMGASETSVTWSLEGDGGIQQDGKYSAPDDVPEPTAARVKATSKKDPTKFGTATVDLSPTIPGAIPR